MGQRSIRRSVAPAISSIRRSHGIESADALLIIGANPRYEASVLNARIRKRWRVGDFPIGVIGEAGELRYDYEYLGAGTDTLSRTGRRQGQVLRQA